MFVCVVCFLLYGCAVLKTRNYLCLMLPPTKRLCKGTILTQPVDLQGCLFVAPSMLKGAGAGLFIDINAALAYLGESETGTIPGFYGIKRTHVTAAEAAYCWTGTQLHTMVVPVFGDYALHEHAANERGAIPDPPMLEAGPCLPPARWAPDHNRPTILDAAKHLELVAQYQCPPTPLKTVTVESVACLMPGNATFCINSPSYTNHAATIVAAECAYFLNVRPSEKRGSPLYHHPTLETVYENVIWIKKSQLLKRMNMGLRVVELAYEYSAPNPSSLRKTVSGTDEAEVAEKWKRCCQQEYRGGLPTSSPCILPVPICPLAQQENYLAYANEFWDDIAMTENPVYPITSTSVDNGDTFTEFRKVTEMLPFRPTSGLLILIDAHDDLGIKGDRCATWVLKTVQARMARQVWILLNDASLDTYPDGVVCLGLSQNRLCAPFDKNSALQIKRLKAYWADYLHVLDVPITLDWEFTVHIQSMAQQGRIVPPYSPADFVYLCIDEDWVYTLDEVHRAVIHVLGEDSTWALKEKMLSLVDDEEARSAYVHTNCSLLRQALAKKFKSATSKTINDLLVWELLQPATKEYDPIIQEELLRTLTEVLRLCPRPHCINLCTSAKKWLPQGLSREVHRKVVARVAKHPKRVLVLLLLEYERPLTGLHGARKGVHFYECCLLETLDAAYKFYPDFDVIVYANGDIQSPFYSGLINLHPRVQLSHLTTANLTGDLIRCNMADCQIQKLARFMPLFQTDIDVAIIWDIDNQLTARTRSAHNSWLASKDVAYTCEYKNHLGGICCAGNFGIKLKGRPLQPLQHTPHDGYHMYCEDEVYLERLLAENGVSLSVWNVPTQGDVVKNCATNLQHRLETYTRLQSITPLRLGRHANASIFYSIYLHKVSEDIGTGVFAYVNIPTNATIGEFQLNLVYRTNVTRAQEPYYFSLDRLIKGKALVPHTPLPQTGFICKDDWLVSDVPQIINHNHGSRKQPIHENVTFSFTWPTGLITVTAKLDILAGDELCYRYENV